MPKGWESCYGLNATDPNDAAQDADNDTLANYNEYLVNESASWNETLDGTWWNGTDPRCNDTDADFRLDGTEWSVSPGADNDLDDDLVPDVLDGDDDEDGVDTVDELEGWNVTYILVNETEIEIFTCSDPLDPDTDGDGLGDFVEWNASMNASFNDTDHDGYLDYLEYTNESYDPLEVERNRPWSANTPGIKVCEDWGEYGNLERCWVHIEISVYDDVGLDHITLKVLDNGKRKMIPFYGAKSGYAHADLDIDYWGDAKWDFTVEATIVDVNNNTFRCSNVGGLKKEVSDFFLGLLFQFNPEFMGGVWGFFASFLKNMYDDWTMIFHLQEMWDGICKIKDMLGSINIGAMIDGMVQDLTNQAKAVNPFNPATRKDKHDQFNNGYKSGAATGMISYLVFSMVVDPGAAMMKAVKSVSTCLKTAKGISGATTKTAKLTEKGGDALKESAIKAKRVDKATETASDIPKPVAMAAKGILEETPELSTKASLALAKAGIESGSKQFRLTMNRFFKRFDDVPLSKLDNGDVIAHVPARNTKAFLPQDSTRYFNDVNAMVPSGYAGATRKAAFAEKAAQKYAVDNLDAVKILTKGDNPNANGVDMFFKDKKGNWNVADSKHFSNPSHSVSPSNLKTTIYGDPGYELSDDWIRRHLIDMKKSGDFDPNDLKEIENAIDNGKLQRHVIITHSTGSGTAGPSLLKNSYKDFPTDINTHTINIDNLETRWEFS